jgi:hypothetical protein
MNTSRKKDSESLAFGLRPLDFAQKLRPVDPKIAGALYRPNCWRRAAPQQQRTIP